MNNKKAFFMGLFCTLAVILPMYLLFAAISISTSQALPTENKQSNVPIAQPGAKDAKTVLIISESLDNKDNTSYAIVRFDAIEHKIAVAAFLPQTIVLRDGKGVTLNNALQSAGPAQAVACIKETLSIDIDNYIKATPEGLAELCRGLGIANVLLANYISQESLAQLKLSVAGIEEIALSPQRLAMVLQSGAVPQAQLCAVRADGYLAFLRAGHEILHEVLPTAIKKGADTVKTDISATDIFDYERILKFLSRSEPEYKSASFTGTYAQDRFDLSETALQTALEYFS